MKAKDIYYKLQEITRGTYNFQDQMILVSHWVESKQLPKKITLDELRTRFEASNENWENSSFINNQYANGTVQIMWLSWRGCYTDLNLLKEAKR